MAHQTEIVINGVTTEVTEFDHTAQEIDDMCDAAQSILPDGPGLPVSQGGTGATNQQGALANLGAGVRPNLLDNAIFIGGGSQQGGGQLPVNQRGQASYTAAEYCIDRWILDDNFGGVSLTLNQGYIRLRQTDVGTKAQSMCQIIEKSRVFAGEIYTVSVLTRGLGHGQILIYLNEAVYKTFYFTNTSDFSVQAFQFEMPEITSDTLMVYLCADTSGSLGYSDFKAAKLEEGDTQTLAYQDDTGAWQLLPQPESDYATQLAKCQRYLLVLKGLAWIGIGVCDSTNSGQFFIPTPVSMRIAPTITGLVSIYNYPTNTQVENNSISGFTQNGVNGFFSTQDTSLESSKTVFLHLANTEQIILSAEL